MGFGGWACVILLCASMRLAAQPATASPARNQAAPDRDHPTLSHRPPPGGTTDGEIKLDVVVTDSAGRPVIGLEQKDFTLLDNKKPRAIFSFQAVDGSVGAGPGEPPTEVILLIDAANTPLQVVGDERNQIERFFASEWREADATDISDDLR